MLKKSNQFLKVRLMVLRDELHLYEHKLQEYENEQNEVPFKLNLTYELLNDKIDELSNHIWNLKTEIEELNNKLNK